MENHRSLLAPRLAAKSTPSRASILLKQGLEMGKPRRISTAGLPRLRPKTEVKFHSLFRSSRVLKRGGLPMVPAAPNFFLAYLARGGRPEDQEQHDEREADEEQDLGDARRRTRDPAETEHCGDQCRSEEHTSELQSLMRTSY